MSVNNDKTNLDLLEEDDEFEEFPCDDWASQDEDADDVTVWEDNWDDDNVKDDFSQQLRSQMSNPKETPKK
uniref:26S proteasome complex subunit SEM1 n=1 Tax=Xenopsylla cheopis TaxID=163159 RepID=A0A6M2DQG0_XENCH